MADKLISVIDGLEADGRPNLRNSLSVTWVSYKSDFPLPGEGYGAQWGEQRLFYPASIVKLFYAIAIERWLKEDLIVDSQELRRALQKMICNSSNDATSLVVDILTGTRSGPELYGSAMDNWQAQRRLINDWLKTLNWPELNSVNCCQKTWNEEPFGRDNQFYGKKSQNKNFLSTAATARMMESVMTGSIVSPPACLRLRSLLKRTLDEEERKKDPENQVDGFLGEGLPRESQLWSKAGLMSQARHDCAWFKLTGKFPAMLIAFSSGRDRAKDIHLLPGLARSLLDI